MLRNTSTGISTNLTKIFNLSLRRQKVPSEWKISHINPIPKGKDIHLCSNYRPISLLSLPSKILERVVHTHISKFLAAHKLLSNVQFGFRPHSSTQEALLSITNSWHTSLTEHKQIAAVFIDVKKAFDSVPHNHLLKSLHSIGIQGRLLNWLKDYLTSRHQRVMLDRHLSTPLPVTSGVPQGSILGPLLFNVFMNPLSKVQLSPNTRLVLYADDILLSKPIDSTEDKDLFQKDVLEIANWLDNHGLRINHLKTQLLQISRCKGIPPLSVTVNGHVTHPSPHIKYLGVTLTPTLSWSLHISNQTKSTKKLLGRVHRNFRHAPPHLRQKIYQTTIMPKLDSAAQSGTLTSKHLHNKLKVFKNLQPE